MNVPALGGVNLASNESFRRNDRSEPLVRAAQSRNAVEVALDLETVPVDRRRMRRPIDDIHGHRFAGLHDDGRP